VHTTRPFGSRTAVRELITRVMKMRKLVGLQTDDVVEVYYAGGDALSNAVAKHSSSLALALGAPPTPHSNIPGGARPLASDTWEALGASATVLIAPPAPRCPQGVAVRPEAVSALEMLMGAAKVPAPTIILDSVRMCV